MTLWHGTCALHAGWLRLKTLTVCNSYCFTVAAVSMWMNVNIKLYIAFLWKVSHSRKCLYCVILHRWDLSLGQIVAVC
jgi:hypothetical protein